MDPRVSPLAEIYGLNTWLFRNCLDELSEEQARARPTSATNSVAFIAAHVADTRFTILAWIGAQIENPLAPALADARSIEDVREMPTLADIRTAWDVVSDALALRLSDLTAAELEVQSPGRFPIEDRTLLGALTFLAQHDSYHVGQLALLRKYAGLPAMRYVKPH